MKKHPIKLDLAAVFRATVAAYRRASVDESRVRRHARNGTWSHPQVEFVADFLACVKRALTEEEFRLFRLRYLLGAEWRLCSHRDGEQHAADRAEFHVKTAGLERKLALAFLVSSLYP